MSEKLNKKIVNKLNRKWDNIDLTLEDIPDLQYPREGSKKHLSEIDDVKFHVVNPAFTPKFLELSDVKPEKIFKKYIRENNLKGDAEKIGKLCNQLDGLVMNLKVKYDRLRPKNSMINMGDEFPINKIRDSKSPSYPSGHTAIAYFIADILANDNPDARIDLTTVADMIAQSRIDNGLHYQSDLTFGRYIGELAASKIIKEPKSKISENNKMNIHTQIINKKRERMSIVKENFGGYSKEKASEMAEFIRRSNEIERYRLNYSDCLESASLFLQGFPIEYCTENKFIRSHLDGMYNSAKLLPINNINKIINVHKALGSDVLERGNPGMIRNFSHSARSGVIYPEPEHILDHLNTWTSPGGSAFVRHTFYEWVHPFCDGNGRSGRILLAAELEFDFNKILALINDNYLSNLISLSEEIQRKFLK
jgi:hypothetical protein